MIARSAICMCLVLGMCGVPAAVPAGQQETSQAGDIRAKVRSAMRQLWHSHIRTSQEKQSAGQLELTVRVLRSIRFAQPGGRGAKPASKQGPGDSPRRPTSRPATRPAAITPQMLAEIKRLPKALVADPASLAEALRMGGHLDVAARFYAIAAERTSDQAEKAWLLFQRANCLRRTDASAALEAYRKLQAEHPKSLWSRVAQAQARVIEWRRASDLAGLLEEIRQETSE